jgi:hypothetical protein
MYLVRTPFNNDEEGFHKARKRIERQATAFLSCTPKWKKGRKKLSGDYHYWEIEDRNEAMAFMLAFGDQIQEVNKNV